MWRGRTRRTKRIRRAGRVHLGRLRRVTAHGVKHPHRIAHAAGEQAHMVHAGRQWNHPVHGQHASGGLEAHQAAGGGGVTHRAAGVGAGGAQAKPGGHCGARAAARTPGHVLRVPRVAGRCKHIVGRGRAKGKFMAGGFAQTDGARLGQALHHHGVGVWHPVFQGPRVRGGAHATGEQHIFVGDGNAMHGPAPMAGGDLARGLLGLRQGRIGGAGDEGVKLRLLRVGAGQTRLHQLQRGQRAGAQQLTRLRDRQGMQRRIHCGHHVRGVWVTACCSNQSQICWPFQNTTSSRPLRYSSISSK